MRRQIIPDLIMYLQNNNGQPNNAQPDNVRAGHYQAAHQAGVWPDSWKPPVITVSIDALFSLASALLGRGDCCIAK